MKRSLFFAMTVMAGFISSHATTVTVISASVGDAFVPANDTIQLGDTVNFTLTSIHNAREVSQSTYTSKGTTKLAGGWTDVPFGGGKLSGVPAGVHYYVCTNHAGMGMVATLTVLGPTPILTSPNAANYLNAFTFNLPGSAPMLFNMAAQTGTISVMNAEGKTVWSSQVGENGARSLTWDGKSSDGHNLQSSVYYVSLVSKNGAQQITKPVIYMH